MRADTGSYSTRSTGHFAYAKQGLIFLVRMQVNARPYLPTIAALGAAGVGLLAFVPHRANWRR